MTDTKIQKQREVRKGVQERPDSLGQGGGLGGGGGEARQSGTRGGVGGGGRREGG